MCPLFLWVLAKFKKYPLLPLVILRKVYVYLIIVNYTAVSYDFFKISLLYINTNTYLLKNVNIHAAIFIILLPSFYIFIKFKGTV